MMPRSQKPMLHGEGHRAYTLPDHAHKEAWLEEQQGKAEAAAAVKAGTGAPLRPPPPTPVERRRKTLDEVLGFPQRTPDPVDAILAERGKFTEPVPIRPPGAALALDGTQERLELADRPRRSLDEILFGTRLRLR
jgi:hypothetical protein